MSRQIPARRRLRIKKPLMRKLRERENIFDKAEDAVNMATVCFVSSQRHEVKAVNLLTQLKVAQFLQNLSAQLKRVCGKHSKTAFSLVIQLLMSKLPVMTDHITM